MKISLDSPALAYRATRNVFFYLALMSTVSRAFTGSPLISFSCPATRIVQVPPSKHSKLVVNSANSHDTYIDGNILAPKLTVILPAYNEFLRIEETLRSYHRFLSSSSTWAQASQVLVVDDGSTDGTKIAVEAIAETLKQQPEESVPVHCISLQRNSGKGAAVSQGIQDTATIPTDLILIADADGSANITCLDGMFQSLCNLLASSQDKNLSTTRQPRTSGNINWNLPAFVVGRRTNTRKGADSKGSTTKLDRAVLRWGFRTAVKLLCGDLGVSDTQCGFKLLTLSAAMCVYRDLHLPGWSHDVEVLYRAKRQRIPVAEQAVFWEDKEGSKLVTSAGGTAGASLQMLLEISQLRPLYTMGIWK